MARKKRTRKGTGTKRRKQKRNVPARNIKVRGKPSAKKRPAKRKKAGPTKLERLDAARLEIGAEEGTDKLAETRWLTPTKKGFAAVRDEVREVVRSQRGKRTTRDVFSYDLFVTFTGPNGTAENLSIRGASLPVFEWIKERTNEETIVRTCADLVRTKVYDNLRIHFDLISPGKAPKSAKMTNRQAESMMKKIRSGRNTRFKFVLYRTAVKPAKKRRKK